MSDVFGSDNEITWSRLEKELRRIINKVYEHPDCLNALFSISFKKASDRIYEDQIAVNAKTLDRIDTMLVDLYEELESFITFNEGTYIVLKVFCRSYEHCKRISREFQINLDTNFING